jgi:hypothetical protein
MFSAHGFFVQSTQARRKMDQTPTLQVPVAGALTYLRMAYEVRGLFEGRDRRANNSSLRDPRPRDSVFHVLRLGVPNVKPTC